MYQDLALLAVFVFLYSLVCGGLERTPVNGAIVFTAFGLFWGPWGLGVLDLGVGPEGLKTLAELTLALVLFTDASNANLLELRKSFHVPQRLLLLGLPLTILIGCGVGQQDLGSQCLSRRKTGYWMGDESAVLAGCG
jgi:NhaP-type Na+/H+ or K+/H+ antiporter